MLVSVGFFIVGWTILQSCNTLTQTAKTMTTQAILLDASGYRDGYVTIDKMGDGTVLIGGYPYRLISSAKTTLPEGYLICDVISDEWPEFGPSRCIWQVCIAADRVDLLSPTP